MNFWYNFKILLHKPSYTTARKFFFSLTICVGEPSVSLCTCESSQKSKRGLSGELEKSNRYSTVRTLRLKPLRRNVYIHLVGVYNAHSQLRQVFVENAEAQLGVSAAQFRLFCVKCLMEH